MRGRGDVARTLLLLLLFLVGALGCQSRTGNRPGDSCTLAAGMSTDDLVMCGCMPAYSPNEGALMLMSEAQQNNSRTISIVNYMCPIGPAGVARVVVRNGVSTSIYE